MRGHSQQPSLVVQGRSLMVETQGPCLIIGLRARRGQGRLEQLGGEGTEGQTVCCFRKYLEMEIRQG